MVLSILLPFRDASATLPGAVESICNQTFADWELLLLNDGSAGHLPSAVKQQVAEDARIRLLDLPPRGIVAALQTGVEESCGKMLARMDADDVCHPERLEKQIAFLEAHPDVDLVSCQVAFGGDADAQFGYAAHVDWINGLLTHDDMFRNRFVDAPVAHPSVLFRRSALERFGGYREGNFPEDFELWLRWLEKGARFGKAPETLLTWNDSPCRLSRVDARYAMEAFYRIKCEYLLRAVPENRPVWLWGAGRPTRKRFERFDTRHPFSGFVDIDPAKVGRQLQGRPVVLPEQIPADAFLLLGVANPGARERSMAYLSQTDGHIGKDFLPAA